MNYFWDNDRMNCFNDHDRYGKLIPLHIKNRIIAKFIFKDVIKLNPRFFTPTLKNDDLFVADVCKGLIPRSFKV